jgi:uncharacterized membrane protein YjjB (DUF3815 family)
MAIKNYIYEGGVLTAAATVQGAAVGTLTKRVITAAALVNTTGAAVAATVYLVPSGGAVGAANALISARTINPGETYFCPELVNQGINEGGSVQALGLGLTFRYAAKDITNG